MNCRPCARLAVSCLNCARVDHCTILPDSAGGQSFELHSTERLLTYRSLVCDTRRRARPWSVECACRCWHLPLCTYIGRSSTNTCTRSHSSPFSLCGTQQPTAVYWLRPSTHECALLFALHSLYPDSGISGSRILKNPPDPDVAG